MTIVLAEDNKHGASYNMCATEGVQVCFCYGFDGKPLEYCEEVRKYKSVKSALNAIKRYFLKNNTKMRHDTN